MTKVQVEPRLCNQRRRKNDAFTFSATPTTCVVASHCPLLISSDAVKNLATCKLGKVDLETEQAKWLTIARDRFTRTRSKRRRLKTGSNEGD